ncbi:MAG: hypothetical protein ACFE0I_12170 [Elainellaceae cyanobacterium]
MRRFREANKHVSKPWSGVNQPRAETGKFERKYPERRGQAIALRLPQSLDAEVRKVVGWQSAADNAALKAWVEAAIVEKIQRHESNPSSSSSS